MLRETLTYCNGEQPGARIPGLGSWRRAWGSPWRVIAHRLGSSRATLSPSVCVRAQGATTSSPPRGSSTGVRTVHVSPKSDVGPVEGSSSGDVVEVRVAKRAPSHPSSLCIHLCVCNVQLCGGSRGCVGRARCGSRWWPWRCRQRLARWLRRRSAAVPLTGRGWRSTAPHPMLFAEWERFGRGVGRATRAWGGRE